MFKLIILKIKDLLGKNDSKCRLIRLVLLLQEFQLELKNRTGAENLAVDHLIRLEIGASNHSFSDYFLDETVYVVIDRLPLYVNIDKCIFAKTFLRDFSLSQRRR